MLIIGDLNTGRNDLDIEGNGARFHCADQFDAMERHDGLIDLWRSMPENRESREWTCALGSTDSASIMLSETRRFSSTLT